MTRGLRSRAAWLLAVIWLAGAPVEAQPGLPRVPARSQAPTPPSPADPLLDCSLHRYGTRLDDAIAATLKRIVERMPASGDLQAASRSGRRTEVTDILHRESLLQRVVDCPQPVVRGFVEGPGAQIEVAALQPEVCLQLLASPTLAATGFAVSAYHAPSGEARCGMARNPIPKLLTFGRLTQAGRSLPGENTVTVTVRGLVAVPVPVPQRKPNVCTAPAASVGKTTRPSYLAHLRSLQGGYACQLGQGERLRNASLACRSLRDQSIRCTGDPQTACREALAEVQGALTEWTTRPSSLWSLASDLNVEQRADLLSRAMTVTEIEKLDGLLALPGMDPVSLGRLQTEVLNDILDDGALNIDAAFESTQTQRYAAVETTLLDKWLPAIRQRSTSGQSAAQTWASELDIRQRGELLEVAYTLIARELGLGRKRFFVVDDCAAQGFRADTAGAYGPPGNPATLSGKYKHQDTSVADAVLVCANRIRSFADFRLSIETVLEEAMHARQMELTMKATALGESADQASCTQARMFAASWMHSFSRDCVEQPVAWFLGLRRLDIDLANYMCKLEEVRLYEGRPHEFHAKRFALAVGDSVVNAADR